MRRYQSDEAVKNWEMESIMSTHAKLIKIVVRSSSDKQEMPFNAQALILITHFISLGGRFVLFKPETAMPNWNVIIFPDIHTIADRNMS